MRRGALVFILINLVIISLLVRSVFTLLTLLVEDASADAIHRSDIPSPNSSLIEQRPQIIPKIIHQTYKNETIPEHWREAQQSCIDLHPDYEYKVGRGDGGLGATGFPQMWLTKTHISSSGRTKKRGNSLPRNTPGSWRLTTATNSPFSVRTRFVISF